MATGDIMRKLSDGARVAGLALSLMLPANMALADEHGWGDGQLANMTAEWWQWVYSLHGGATENPVQDATGAQCMVGQTGPVWRLAGNFTGQQNVTRTCNVPADRALFFPVINNSQFNSPNACGQDATNYTVKDLRDNVAPAIDHATNLTLRVDGRDESHMLRRVKSAVFSVTLGANNIYTDFGIACAAGVYSPAVDDGYYAFLPPLKPGAHSVYFHAESPDITVDITYNLTMVPVVRH